MDTSSLAGSTRVSRGVELFLTRRHEIVRVKAHTYRVPSCTTDEEYLVWTQHGNCSCPDSRCAKDSGGVCKHVVAARLAQQHRRELRVMAKKEVAKTKR